MLSKKHQRGFIDPISLFAIGFLVVSLIVGTKVATDRRKSLDIREKAAVDIGDGGGGNACTSAGGDCYIAPSCAKVGKQIVNGGNGCGSAS